MAVLDRPKLEPALWTASSTNWPTSSSALTASERDDGYSLRRARGHDAENARLPETAGISEAANQVWSRSAGSKDARTARLIALLNLGVHGRSISGHDLAAVP